MIKKALFLEFVLFYFGFPLLFPLGVLPKKPIPFIIFSALVMCVILKKDKSFDYKSLTSLPKAWYQQMLLPLLAASMLFVALVYFLQPDKLLLFPKSRPNVWLMIMVLYPILSAYPQEVIFRAFLFHRYKNLFNSEDALIIASSIVFGLAHLMFGSSLSVVLSFIGGILFSKTYLRTNSLMAAAIEHAVYGQLLFTIGLGNHFYHR